MDDNTLNVQLIHRYLLKRKEDTIITANNGLEAVAAFRQAVESGRRFDVIFMDISMPQMDGFEATRQIRELENLWTSQEKSAPSDGSVTVKCKRAAYVIALTGLASQRDRNEARKSGFDDFLTKPIYFAKIGTLLEKLTQEPGTA